MNLRLVRKKIKAVDNIKKITNAMQLVSSIKMKKSQMEYREGKFYRQFLEKMVKELVGKIDKQLSPLLSAGPGKKNLYFVISTNKGLCGNFNFILFKKIYQQINFTDSDFIIYGKKGMEFINRFGGKILADFSGFKPQNVISAIFDYSLKTFFTGEYKNFFIVYNRFISSTTYNPVIEKVIPVSLEEKEEETNNTALRYLIEPSPKEILDSLLKDNIEQKIRDAVLSSQAGEHSARMSAMKNATDNAKEIGYHLTLLRNKLRQEKITYELLDMTTAMESMKDSKGIM